MLQNLLVSAIPCWMTVVSSSEPRPSVAPILSALENSVNVAVWPFVHRYAEALNIRNIRRNMLAQTKSFLDASFPLSACSDNSQYPFLTAAEQQTGVLGELAVRAWIFSACGR